MILDAITSRDLKAHTSSGAGGLAVSGAIGSVDRGSFYTESVGGSVLRTSGDLITPIRSSGIDDQGRGTGCDPALDPPPAYETIVAPLTLNGTRRVLKRSACRPSCYRSQPHGDSRDRITSETGESREMMHTIRGSLVIRTVPESLTYERLPRPFVIQAQTSKHKLPDLFASVGTPALPLHDVHESDWDNLLQDLVACSRYSTGQRIIAGFLPVTKHLGPPGCLANFVVEQGMRKGKLSKSFELLDIWNEQFFRPRRLEVILCKGDRCKSGRRSGFLAPDRINVAPRQNQNSTPEQADKDYRLVVISV
ncbi:hypothetical protein RhiXN_05065 [Rhizoctonia solani]|uniref:Uncharacterized protein n=1 Tax=Rhizoctonia solani TaxID=456999 RepID=A0A8H8NRL5_9AGAM|nr:uncharacterized protein RhiXN_05065 [Rhizoctonia solani]QRW17063.1 hypothetical protein RhiXN_05065 [Rhizoctonia solani]